VRYLDSGTDDPAQSLGAWLTGVLRVPGVTELRWQTGYFDAAGLGPMLPVLASGAMVHAVIGSNDAATSADAVNRLLACLGPPRANASVGVVSYSNGLFHPKVYHVRWHSGEQAAYIGSANLTKAAVSALNVEAGITLDSREGDSAAFLDGIAARIDAWFAAPSPPGFSIVEPASVAALVASGLLAAAPPPPPLPPRPPAAGGVGAGARPGRRALFRLPDVPPLPAAPAPPPPRPAPAPTGPLMWEKRLSMTDAQRQTGHATGDLRLVQAGFRVGGALIDWTTYFRRTVFGAAAWTTTANPQGKLVEKADVEFDITILGQPLGRQTLTVGHKPSGEAGQGNYTTSIRWGAVVHAVDVTGCTLRLYAPPHGQRAPFVLEVL
jgi:hypothetical protein